MGEIFLDQNDVESYLVKVKVESAGYPEKTMRNGREYVKFSFTIKMKPLTRLIKIIQALAVTLLTCACALISERFRRFWGEAVLGKEPLILLASKDDGSGLKLKKPDPSGVGLDILGMKRDTDFNKNPLTLLVPTGDSLNEKTPEEGDAFDTTGVNFEDLFSSLGKGDIRTHYEEARKLLFAENVSLEDVLASVSVFVDMCIESFDSFEHERLSENWNAYGDLKKPSKTKLEEIFVEAACVFKDYKESNPDKVLDKLNEVIELNKAALDPTSETIPHDKDSEDLIVEGYQVSICRAQGSRVTMEDSDIADIIEVQGMRIPYFGVFDGHGGSDCSKLLKEELFDFLLAELENIDLSSPIEIDSALKSACVKMNSSFREDKIKDGSTAIFALIINKHIYVSNVGDSRAVLNADGRAIQLSKDAKPTVEIFNKSARSRGGLIYNKRLNGVLAVARAFGDVGFKGVTARPHNHMYPLSGDHLILACDGLFDVVGSEEAAHIVQGKSSSEACEDLFNEAFKRGTKDNVTVMVIDLRGCSQT